MGLSKQASYDELQNILNNSAAARAAATQTQTTSTQKGGLAGVLSNIANWVGDTAGAIINTGTTNNAAAGSLIQTARNNAAQKANTEQGKKDRDTIVQKYGYENYDDMLNKTEGQEAVGDMWDELRAQATSQSNKTSDLSEQYKNNASVQKIANTDQAQYGADAIKTWNTLADLATLGTGGGFAANLALNTGQGALSGVGDELQRVANTGDEFNWSNAGKNALAQGAAGAATTLGNELINSRLAANGGKVFTGEGKLAKLGNAVTTGGVSRGAISGAIGGGVGSGIAAGLEGGDVLSSALSGAKSGAAAGGVIGGTLGLANKASQGIKNRFNTTGEVDTTTTQKAAQATTAPEAETEALMYGDSELAKQTKAKGLQDRIQRVAETMEGAQSSTTRVQNRKLGIKSSGEVIDNVRKKTGISDLDTQGKIAKELTGGENSLLDNIQRQALSATEDGTQRVVDTKNVTGSVEKLVNDNISNTNLSGTQRQKFVNNLKQDIVTGDTISASNRLKEQASVLYGKRENMTPLDKQTAKVYSKVAEELDDLSYKAVPQGNVDAMFETAVSEMRGRANQAKQSGNVEIEKAYSKMADTLESEPHTIQNFRSFKKDFVDASKMNDLSLQGEQSVLAQNGANISSNVKRFVNKALQVPTNRALAAAGGWLSDTAAKMTDSNAGSAVAKTGSSIANAAKNTVSAVNSADLASGRLADAMGREIGRTEGNTTLEQALANTAQNNAYDTQNALNTVYGTTGTSTSLSGANTGNSTLNQVSTAMQLALSAGDIEAFNELATIYSTLNSIYGTTTSSDTKLSQTQQRANAAMNSLERLATMTPDTAYNLSGIPIIGDIATFGGNDYESEAKSLAQQIGYMVSGANIKESEAEAIGKAYVPQPFDSESTRLSKLQRAKEIIQQYQNGYATE